MVVERARTPSRAGEERDDGPADLEKVAWLRQQLPSVTAQHYLNNGRYGPIPSSVSAVIAGEMAVESQRGRGSMPGRAIDRLVGNVRERVEGLLGAAAGTVALTHNASEGINIAVTSQRWSVGDEILTLTTEHESALAALEAAAWRHGVVVRRVDAHTTADGVVDRLTDALSERTRMLMISHVSWTTGALLPLRAVADACHARGVLVVADGAQSAGAIPVDVADLDVDFYAIPGQKWLCGPSGTGALYVRDSLIADALPGVAGYASIDEFDPATGACGWFADARRFEGASDSVPLRAGFGESLRWLAEEVEHPWLQRRIREGARRCRALLEEIPGVRVLTPVGDQAGLVCFGVGDAEPEQVVLSLLRRRIVVREAMPPQCVRACVGFYTTEDDLLMLRDAVASVAERHPGPPVGAAS